MFDLPFRRLMTGDARRLICELLRQEISDMNFTGEKARGYGIGKYHRTFGHAWLFDTRLCVCCFICGVPMDHDHDILQGNLFMMCDERYRLIFGTFIRHGVCISCFFPSSSLS